MKTYKGFNKDMTAQNGFQYKEEKEYEEEKAVACERGFHACEYPLDCFRYYSPGSSVYHLVEQSGEFSKNSDDSKVASTKIKIGAEISIAGLVKAAIEYTKERTKPECDATGNCGASSATGDYGASSATGYKGASSATGDYGASSATGDKGSAIAGDPESIAIAWGYKGKAKGILGSYLVLADWEGNEGTYWRQEGWSLKGAKMIRVDGDKIKADTWYTMKKRRNSGSGGGIGEIDRCRFAD